MLGQRNQLARTSDAPARAPSVGTHAYAPCAHRSRRMRPSATMLAAFSTASSGCHSRRRRSAGCIARRGLRHVRTISRNLAAPWAIPGKFSMFFISVGTARFHLLDHGLDRVVGVKTMQSFDAVDARVDQPGQHILAERVDRGAGAVGVRPAWMAASGRHRTTGVRSPASRSIQSPTSSPSRRRTTPVRRRHPAVGTRLRVDRGTTLVALGPGKVAARPDDARQVVVIVEAAGVDWGTGMAQEQRTDIAFRSACVIASSRSVAPWTPGRRGSARRRDRAKSSRRQKRCRRR